MSITLSGLLSNSYQGAQGFQGAQGVKGSTGADSTVQGPQGEQGAVGPTGAQGAQGRQGVQGAVGPSTAINATAVTTNATFSCGTSLFAHKDTKLRNENDFGDTNVFESGFYDRTNFELVDTAGNIFNRLVIFDAKCIHSANEYFGTDITNSRLFHLFFFD